MARPKREQPPRILTDVELQLVSVLWDLGEGTVRDVLTRLPKERDLAYTTVSTILRVLEQKEVLTSRREGRAHVYSPAVSRAEYERRTVRDLSEKVFDHQPAALVRRLLDTEDLSPEELEEIRRLIERRLR